jgi:2-polyprenyl-3-methyl-5-hydroxy-6-metoxy-1,4-benzoquinol methylase
MQMLYDRDLYLIMRFVFFMKTRSTELEWMDLGSSFYSEDEYADCLTILFKINRLLGFFKTTVRLLSRMPDARSLVDIGCGGGLFILHLSRYYPNIALLGIDISKTAIAEAQKRLQQWKQNNPSIQVDFKPQDALNLALSPNEVDVVLTTLVCHHIDDEALVVFLQQVFAAARVAVIVNDLQRHRLAYWGYQVISPILFRNRLITHDGLISIKRSFTRKELVHLLKRANITTYELKWAFPFRWSLVLWKQ